MAVPIIGLMIFLHFCYKNKVPVDFLTRHAYTGKPPQYTPHFVYQDVHPIEYMLNEFKSVREKVRNSPFPDLPIHITEFNSSYHPLCPIHDTPFNAAYLARVLSEAGDYVDSFFVIGHLAMCSRKQMFQGQSFMAVLALLHLIIFQNQFFICLPSLMLWETRYSIEMNIY